MSAGSKQEAAAYADRDDREPNTFATLPSELKVLALLSADCYTLGACVRVSSEMCSIVQQRSNLSHKWCMCCTWRVV